MFEGTASQDQEAKEIYRICTAAIDDESGLIVDKYMTLLMGGRNYRGV